MLTVETVATVVIAAIQELTSSYGIVCPTLLPTTRPFTEIAGLDSLHCVEMIVDICNKIPLDTDNNVFWDASGMARTITEAANYLYARQRQQRLS